MADAEGKRMVRGAGPLQKVPRHLQRRALPLRAVVVDQRQGQIVYAALRALLVLAHWHDPKACEGQ